MSTAEDLRLLVVALGVDFTAPWHIASVRLIDALAAAGHTVVVDPVEGTDAASIDNLLSAISDLAGISMRAMRPLVRGGRLQQAGYDDLRDAFGRVDVVVSGAPLVHDPADFTPHTPLLYVELLRDAGVAHPTIACAVQHPRLRHWELRWNEAIVEPEWATAVGQFEELVYPAYQPEDAAG